MKSNLPSHIHVQRSAKTDATGAIEWVPPVSLLLMAMAALLSALAFPLEPTMRSYLEGADKLMQGHQLKDHFLPVGYSGFVYLCLLSGIPKALALAQAAVYVAAMLLARQFIVQQMSQTPRWAVALLWLVIALHPYVLLNIHRANDNAVNVLLMFTLWYWIHKPSSRSLTPGSHVLMGLALGWLVLVRPNSVSVVPVLLLVSLVSSGAWFLRLTQTFTWALTAAITYACLAWAITGSVLFWPDNGPYNLYAGNNPISNETLLARGNGEESLEPVLRSQGLLPPGLPPYELPPELFDKLAKQHMSEHPLEVAKGVFIKAWVLLGPDLRQAHTLPKVLVQYVLALPFFIWVCALGLSIRAGRWQSSHWPGTLFLLFYIAPFLVFNADARFRLPVLDALFLLSAFKIFHDTFATKEAHSRQLKKVHEQEK